MIVIRWSGNFCSPNEAIDGLATKYLNLNYINPTSDPKTDYANGAAVGNKSSWL